MNPRSSRYSRLFRSAPAASRASLVANKRAPAIADDNAAPQLRPVVKPSISGSEEEKVAEPAAPSRKQQTESGTLPSAEQASIGPLRAGMPAPLRGSLASLQHQNDMLDQEGLERIQDEDDLAARIASKLLVPVPVSDALSVNTNLPENHRYCRPWTARFLSDLAKAHDALFHRPLEVSSAVRTVEYQKHLMRTNGNAAAAEGDIVSPHLTGATIDIAKSGLTRQEIAWMRRELLALQQDGKIDVEEEFRQSCFHITVYKNYVPGHSAAPQSPGTARPDGPSVPDSDQSSQAEGM